MAYFVVTEGLRERLLASSPARIVNVSSAAHKGARLDFTISVFRLGPRDTVIPSFLAEFREPAEAFDNGKIKGRMWGHHFLRL
jgi:hypothetical protein